jgi:hypothetical protein
MGPQAYKPEETMSSGLNDRTDDDLAADASQFYSTRA